MPPAARIADFHVCPMVNPGPVPHVGGPVSSGSPNVIIGFMPAGRKTDTAICVPAVDSIKKGSSNVLINNLDAARIGDPTVHNGVIVMGCPTVIIGQSAQGSTLAGAAKDGAPFCEECEKAKKALEASKRQQQGKDSLPAPVATPPADEPTPPDAVKYEEGKGALTHVSTPPEVLAKQRNKSPDDGLNGARYAAREQIAREFYAKHCPEMSPADIASHVRCIDLDKPVEAVKVPPDGAGKGNELYQRGFPDKDAERNGEIKNGQYFTTSPMTTPSEVGAWSNVASKDAPPRTLVRDHRTITFDKPAHGLKSTAAPAVDFWSVNTAARKAKGLPGLSKRTPGGATQIMIPRGQQAGKTSTVIRKY